MREMLRVSRQAPCPICGKIDYCGFSADGEIAICMRVEGLRTTKNGGHLHILTERKAGPVAVQVSKPDTATMFDAQAYYDALMAGADWQDVEGLAGELGVSVEALAKIGPVYDRSKRAFAFPMRNVGGRVTGLRLRNWRGKKWTVRGSKDGLFTDPDLRQAQELYICEGPTDTAAAMSLGLCAIGRPSCRGAVDLVKAYARRVRAWKVTIIADYDWEKVLMTGGRFKPGIDGADALAQQLGLTARIVQMPGKDIRQFVAEGGRLRDFDNICAWANYRIY